MHSPLRHFPTHRPKATQQTFNGWYQHYATAIQPCVYLSNTCPTETYLTPSNTPSTICAQNYILKMHSPLRHFPTLLQLTVPIQPNKPATAGINIRQRLINGAFSFPTLSNTRPSKKKNTNTFQHTFQYTINNICVQNYILKMHSPLRHFPTHRPKATQQTFNGWCQHCATAFQPCVYLSNTGPTETYLTPSNTPSTICVQNYIVKKHSPLRPFSRLFQQRPP